MLPWTAMVIASLDKLTVSGSLKLHHFGARLREMHLNEKKEKF